MTFILIIKRAPGLPEVVRLVGGHGIMEPIPLGLFRRPLRRLQRLLVGCFDLKSFGVYMPMMRRSL